MSHKYDTHICDKWTIGFNTHTLIFIRRTQSYWIFYFSPCLTHENFIKLGKWKSAYLGQYTPKRKNQRIDTRGTSIFYHMGYFLVVIINIYGDISISYFFCVFTKILNLSNNIWILAHIKKYPYRRKTKVYMGKNI